MSDPFLSRTIEKENKAELESALRATKLFNSLREVIGETFETKGADYLTSDDEIIRFIAQHIAKHEKVPHHRDFLRWFKDKYFPEKSYSQYWD